MEIKTLEQYAIMKLEEKDNRIEELEREQDKLMAKIDEFTQNFKKLGEFFEVRSWNDGTGMYVAFDCGYSNSYSDELREQFYWVVDVLGLKLPEINKHKGDKDES